MKIEEETFGYRIRYLRENLGMTRDQLADRIGVALQDMKIINGYQNFKPYE